MPLTPYAVDAVVVRFDKVTGGFEEKRVANMHVAFSAFKAALYLWKMSKAEGKRLTCACVSTGMMAAADHWLLRLGISFAAFDTRVSVPGASRSASLPEAPVV